ncbi:Flp pilus assembly complex ATPase component TadA [Nocardioides piscis]|uniref:Flp pilus assembly complex ATPase component TadA n=1 Tax=Nocardioides piscis TaxID=2714938 RepID=A0A6G7YBY0_9ACTN|nr:Flp pilus assembly complex ATPase component TadA [Nocardioides piscis]QIK74117.1 Flp pilus assembly complex ATPase component TadA [Nocardioides piscis]
MTLTRPDSHADLLDDLDALVREQVRAEGVDPQRDAVIVRRIAEDVVRRHDERSLTGAVAPVTDPGATVGELIARVSGFGPLQPFLDDPEVEEIWINAPERVFVARRGRHELTNLMLSSAQVDELIERMLKSSGRRIDISQPFVCVHLRSPAATDVGAIETHGKGVAQTDHHPPHAARRT